MSLPIEDQITGFNESDVGVLQKILNDIRNKATSIRYVTSAPDSDSIAEDELVIFDDGSEQKIFFRTAKGAVKSLSPDIRAENDIEVVIENRTSDPSSPATGRIWLRTDL